MKLKMDRKKFINILKKTWHFIWEDDSLLSWIVNIVLAIVLIKFIIYPGLGLVLGTGFPVVAVAIANQIIFPLLFTFASAL